MAMSFNQLRALWNLSLFLLISAVTNSGYANTPAPPPNIIFVLVDDMGWSDLSCFGGIRARTPNIDQLAERGLRFRNFYVNAPICSPSRVAFTTGQYPHRRRITSYLDNRAQNSNRQMAQWLDPAAPVIARELKRAGYRTGHFGKWHMGGQRDVAEAPTIDRYGFDVSLTNFEGLGPKLLPLTQQPTWPSPRKIWEKAEILGGPVTWMERSKITSGYVQAAIQFIDAAQTAHQPFYINVWPDDVHSPFYPSLDRWSDDKAKRYDAVLEQMDAQLQPLFDRISTDEALNSNTIIILCSDNGHEHGAGNSKPLRGSKTWLYEGGVRSPLIIYAPNRIPKDQEGSWNDSSIFAPSISTVHSTHLPILNHQPISMEKI
jgi:arylsulfatase A-like enzyme